MKKDKYPILKSIFFKVHPKTRNLLFYILSIIATVSNKKYRGWGRKKTGEFALKCQIKYGGMVIRYEDGFIRSLGLGVDKSPSFSIVEDEVGIYLDATNPSKLENILNTYEFSNDPELINTANEAIELIRKHHISKYNHAPNIDEQTFKNLTNKKVLIIAQTSGDASLEYGLATEESVLRMMTDAINENPNASFYIKIHPDVISGKKESHISPDMIPDEFVVLDQDINPISLLKNMDMVYTCTSGMGMEALILNKKVICYGLPFYSGWGLTEDKIVCDRRKRKLTIEELFAGAYILYTQYFNPYTKKPTDIIGTINEIATRKANG